MDIDKFERFVEVINGLLWFGVRPIKSTIKTELVENDVSVVYNLRKPAQTVDVCWYSDEMCDTVINHKYQFEDGFNDRAEILEVSCDEIIKCAKEIVNHMRNEHAVFVHGFGAMEYATVVSLVAWFMFKNDKSFDPIVNFHNWLIGIGMEQYTDDFPKGQLYIDLIKTCIRRINTSIETSFRKTLTASGREGIKKIKTNPEDEK
jgi:hypothetical protein